MFYSSQRKSKKKNSHLFWRSVLQLLSTLRMLVLFRLQTLIIVFLAEALKFLAKCWSHFFYICEWISLIGPAVDTCNEVKSYTKTASFRDVWWFVSPFWFRREKQIIRYDSFCTETFYLVVCTLGFHKKIPEHKMVNQEWSYDFWYPCKQQKCTFPTY